VSDITLEILKRYLVLSLIESGSMTNSKDLMKEINDNAMQTAKNLKGINDMFGSRPVAPPPQMANPFNQQHPPVFNQQQQEPAYTNAQIVNMITGMQNQFIDMQNQMFKGLQDLYNTLQSLVNAVDNKNIQNQVNQKTNQNETYPR